MVPRFHLSREIFVSLMEADAEISRRVAVAGCRFCGGALHQANYHRKVRGGLMAPAGEAFSLRHSLCCGRRGCRKRTLPPSLRFLGRRVYLGAIVVLASVIWQTTRRMKEAVKATAVPGWTLRRWRVFFLSAFVAGRAWIELRARFAPPAPDESDLPRSLFERAVKGPAC